MHRSLPALTGLALIAVLALSACAPGAAPEEPSDSGPSELEPGACLAEYNGVDSDRTSIVPCTETHVFDVVGIATWPEMADRIAGSSAAEVFEDIQADETTELNDAYWRWAYAECNAALRSAIGMGGIAIEGSTSDEMDMVPGDLFFTDPSLASKDAFEAGDNSTVCSVRWVTADNEDLELAYPSGMTVLDLMSPDFPIDRRSCFFRPDSGDYAGIACSEPHSGQYLVYFDGVESIGVEYLATLDPVTKLFDDYETLDAYCQALLDAVYPGVLDSDDWVVWSDALDDQSGWADFEGTIDPAATYPMYCGIYGGDGGSLTGDALATRLA